jgi:hypothetical protein
MKTVLAPRASAILYEVLRSRGNNLPFLLPANICPIVPMTFLKSGTPFEFVDISPESLHMDTDLVERRLRSDSGQYGGILYAHTYGDPTTPSEFFRWVKDRWNGLVVIDDRCLCIPELEPAEQSGVDVTLFSTGYAKIADIGLGGFAFLRDELTHEHHGLPFDELELRATEVDYKASINAGRRYAYRDSAWLQTEVALPTWDEYAGRVRQALQETIAQRRVINAVYNSVIPAELQLGIGFQLWRFNLRLPNKDVALKAIFDAGLFASSHYRSLVGIMGEGMDANASDLSAHVVNLFNDHHYTIDMAERTAGIIVRSL